MNNIQKFVYIVTAEAPFPIEDNGNNTAMRHFDNSVAADECALHWLRKGFKVLYSIAPVFSSFDEIK